ncbi:MAG: YceI family protein [Acidimicrobiia bacterium]|nr:YceI family protein [Acidimicrobiia bacterium]
MKRVLAVVTAIGVLGAGVALAWFYSNADAEPSTDLTAPPIETSSTVAAAESTLARPTSYIISSAESSVSFTLNEELRGADATVVGSTDQVAGEIVVDFDNPSASLLGDVVVNARTFATDSNNRNRAIRGIILNTDTFEFITFSPTSIDGLPTGPTDEFTFTVTGDLTIRDTTKPVTFDVQVSGSADRIEGSASSTVNRADFDLLIPNVPFVANVDEEVSLKIDFVALPG